MHRRKLNVAAYAAIGLLAVLLWPQRWGGSMTYDITHGSSMQPAFQTGDLAILRTAGSYRVGDVAAYRSPSLHTTVMHRVKTVESRRYTFQGDNNDFVDPDIVTDKEMLGRLVVRVPKVGLAVAWLLEPLHLALAGGGLFLLIADRREKAAPAPAAAVVAAAEPARAPSPLVVRITALRLPQELPTADVVAGSDLLALAERSGLAVLRDGTTDYVLHSGMVFRHVREAVAQVPDRGDAARRRPSATGRDWTYGTDDDLNVVWLPERRDTA